MHGLSADKLRVLLHPYDDDEEQGQEDGDDDSEFGFESISAAGSGNGDGDGDKPDLKDLLGGGGDHDEVKGSGGMDFRESVVLTTLQDSTRGEWKATQVLYSFPDRHKVWTRGNKIPPPFFFGMFVAVLFRCHGVVHVSR